MEPLAEGTDPPGNVSKLKLASTWASSVQNPSKKSEYLPDATLKKILPADVITFTEISKLLSSHFPKAAPKAPKAPKVPKAPKEKKGAKVNDTD